MMIMYRRFKRWNERDGTLWEKKHEKKDFETENRRNKNKRNPENPLLSPVRFVAIATCSNS
jgi:hypothetical protein